MLDNIFGKEKESVWIGIDRQLRKLMFAVVHEILQANRVSPLIYKILLLIEGIQIAYYSINVTFSYLWNSSITGVMQNAIEYFQISGPMQKMDSTVSIYKLRRGNNLPI